MSEPSISSPLEGRLDPGLPEDRGGFGQAKLRSAIGLRLAIGMFLQHFSVGTWSVTLASYVKANSGDAGAAIFSAGFVGIVYSAGPLGGMVTPFLTGILADRYFSSERLMAVLHLLAAGCMFLAFKAGSAWQLYCALLFFYVFYLPTFTLITSMTMHHFADPHRRYPAVRAMGTVGWIFAGLFVGGLWPIVTGHSIEATAIPLALGAVVELVNACYSATLPHTPPNLGEAPGESKFGHAAVRELLGNPSFLALLVVAVLSHSLPQFYYAYCNVFMNWAKVDYAAAKMTAGQVVEVLCMVGLPVLLRWRNPRGLMLVGLAVWAVRYFLLAYSAAWGGSGALGSMALAVVLHGASFALTNLTLQLEADRIAGRRLRATAQGLAIISTQIGYFLGAQAAGLASVVCLPAELGSIGAGDWRQFWLVPAVGMTFATLVSAWLLSHPRVAEKQQKLDDIKS
jgi:MFS family permease